MRSIEVVRGFGYPTMTYKELRLLRKSIIDEIDLSSPSSINGLTKRVGFEILFDNYSDIDSFPDDMYLNKMHFRNVIREFVIRGKKMDDSYEDIIIIKELHDFREERLDKLFKNS
ncbi:MAG: hypothetical protein SLAVMIC_00276 [uncultured marine phage]|uniref:Uncharacterized protein n=1 Tax=uncultured marine phage TaxID=707152 RepID=A0A8D9CEW7_9VIRU|nr:MAG: hypothetical protein SLAVMIC_00276 [uncultured marine phage]